MFSVKNVVAVAVLTLGLGGFAACGGDDPSTSGSDSAGATTGSSGSGATATSGGSTTGGGTTSGGGEECGAGAVNQDDPCELCAAQNCTAEALACCQIDGCLDIIACAQETGCDGINCYTPDTCQAEIDAAGGPNTATNYAMPLGECAAEKCAAECSLMGS